MAVSGRGWRARLDVQEGLSSSPRQYRCPSRPLAYRAFFTGFELALALRVRVAVRALGELKAEQVALRARSSLFALDLLKLERASSPRLGTLEACKRCSIDKPKCYKSVRETHTTMRARLSGLAEHLVDLGCNLAPNLARLLPHLALDPDTLGRARVLGRRVVLALENERALRVRLEHGVQVRARAELAAPGHGVDEPAHECRFVSSRLTCKESEEKGCTRP